MPFRNHSYIQFATQFISFPLNQYSDSFKCLFPALDHWNQKVLIEGGNQQVLIEGCTRQFRSSTKVLEWTNKLLAQIWVMYYNNWNFTTILLLPSDYSFSTYTKLSEELTFFTPWYAHVHVRIRGNKS